MRSRSIGRRAFWGRVVFKPAWWWVLDGGPLMAGLYASIALLVDPAKREVFGIVWWGWFLLTAGIAVILILEGAYRVLRERETEYESELVQVRTDAEERLALLRKVWESNQVIAPAISVEAVVRCYGKWSDMQIVVKNQGNCPIQCRAEAALITGRVGHQPQAWAMKWLDKPHIDEGMQLWVEGDTATLEFASFGAKPFFRLGKILFPLGLAYQLVFQMANPAHPEFYVNVPLRYMSLREAIQTMKSGQLNWGVGGDAQREVRIRISYLSLLNRAISGVVTKNYLIRLGPHMGDMSFEEKSCE